MNFKEVMELMATFASGLFAGAALYINAVECPFYFDCHPPNQPRTIVGEFRKS